MNFAENKIALCINGLRTHSLSKREEKNRLFKKNLPYQLEMSFSLIGLIGLYYISLSQNTWGL